jgi:hypothetical protein
MSKKGRNTLLTVVIAVLIAMSGLLQLPTKSDRLVGTWVQILHSKNPTRYVFHADGTCDMTSASRPHLMDVDRWRLCGGWLLFSSTHTSTLDRMKEVVTSNFRRMLGKRPTDHAVRIQFVSENEFERIDGQRHTPHLRVTREQWKKLVDGEAIPGLREPWYE